MGHHKSAFWSAVASVARHRFRLLAKLDEFKAPSALRSAGAPQNNRDGAEAALFRATIPESLQIGFGRDITKARPLVGSRNPAQEFNGLVPVSVVEMPIS